MNNIKTPSFDDTLNAMVKNIDFTYLYKHTEHISGSLVLDFDVLYQYSANISSFSWYHGPIVLLSPRLMCNVLRHMAKSRSR